MAKRRPSKHTRPHRPLSAGMAASKRTVGGRAYVVKQVSGERATKSYVCPGCQHEVRPGMAHIVAWPDSPPLGYEAGVEVRRHWHTACWERTR
ncbi:hypothetical protein [Tessaracoccus caeni]|uniref:hypothetical protein n=1 Tax=Tessaracoccus caeni TaxID=3031239 RepID=UPI0023D98C1C|nr:hypothetical protein [Tessaracoccus caeni]MDF1490361.1 hypothetical protein [Tessaracoccus caeni]